MLARDAATLARSLGKAPEHQDFFELLSALAKAAELVPNVLISSNTKAELITRTRKAVGATRPRAAFESGAQYVFALNRAAKLFGDVGLIEVAKNVERVLGRLEDYLLIQAEVVR